MVCLNRTTRPSVFSKAEQWVSLARDRAVGCLPGGHSIANFARCVSMSMFAADSDILLRSAIPSLQDLERST
jgi:hypothetical protein